MKAGAQAAPHLPSDLLQKILHRLVEARRLGRINDLRGFSAEPEVRSIAGPMSAEGQKPSFGGQMVNCSSPHFADPW